MSGAKEKEVVLVSWDDVHNAAKVLGEFIDHLKLDPRNMEDNKKFWKMAGLSEVGFDDYMMDLMQEQKDTITQVIREAANPEIGLMLLTMVAVSTHLSGVTVGAAATRQVVEGGVPASGPYNERTDDLRGDHDA